MDNESMDVDNGGKEIADSEDEYESSIDGDEMQCDLSAYIMFHEGNAGFPCLSFDIIKDELGEDRSCNNSVTCCFIGGTQANQPQLNSIILMKMENLRNTTDESSDEDSDSEEESSNVKSVFTQHDGCINRIRATTINESRIVATWSELGVVNVWNIDQMYKQINTETHQNNSECKIRPVFSSNNHKTEGFAVDWSTVKSGTLASGCCLGDIYIHSLNDGGNWSTCTSPYKSHTKSVEDIQWSPNEENVFASCSVDKTIKIWDSRSNPKESCKITCEDAHTSDINVINWNRTQPFIASGSDDSQVKIWDLRKFKGSSPLAQLCYHKNPITTVEWHYSDSSVLASGGEDDQVLQWDLAVETKDNELETENIPAQLLFVHKGQTEVKELHWHPQIPGLLITTANSGFNVFKTISC